MSALDDVWSGTALTALAGLTGEQRDQVEALVRALCRDPDAASAPVAGVAGLRVGYADGVAVYFRLDLLGELLYVARVEARG